MIEYAPAPSTCPHCPAEPPLALNTGDKIYRIVLKVPEGIECERCVLQWCLR